MAKLVWQLISPEEIKKKYSLSEEDKKLIEAWRKELADIYSWKDDRKILIIGPCGADFEESLNEYAEFLSGLAEKVQDKIKIVMRFYTGKPRTVWWRKGLQNSTPWKEPNIMTGIEEARRIAVNIIKKYGLLLWDEMLHPNIINYVDDIYSFVAVWARSSENQYHREVSSGLNIPVGMKNPTSGDLQIMVNSVAAWQTPSTYVIGTDVYKTEGNNLSHGVLRWGTERSNYSLEDIQEAYNLMEAKKVNSPAIIVDTNHSNSRKQYEKQIDIMSEVMDSISGDEKLKDFVKWFMVESYLYDGNQSYSEGCKKGLSLVDPCIGKEKTEELVMKLYGGDLKRCF